MGNWSERSWAAIEKVHKSLPADASPVDRMRAIDAAYPLGERAMHPYKIWLKARRKYLANYGVIARRAPPLSPLEKAIIKAEAEH